MREQVNKTHWTAPLNIMLSTKIANPKKQSIVKQCPYQTILSRIQCAMSFIMISYSEEPLLIQGISVSFSPASSTLMLWHNNTTLEGLFLKAGDVKIFTTLTLRVNAPCMLLLAKQTIWPSRPNNQATLKHNICNKVKNRSPPPCRGMLSVIPKTLSLQHCLLLVQSYLSLVLSYKSSQRL